jgi:hypothetical protein
MDQAMSVAVRTAAMGALGESLRTIRGGVVGLFSRLGRDGRLAALLALRRGLPSQVDPTCPSLEESAIEAVFGAVAAVASDVHEKITTVDAAASVLRSGGALNETWLELVQLILAELAPGTSFEARLESALAMVLDGEVPADFGAKVQVAIARVPKALKVAVSLVDDSDFRKAVAGARLRMLDDALSAMDEAKQAELFFALPADLQVRAMEHVPRVLLQPAWPEGEAGLPLIPLVEEVAEIALSHEVLNKLSQNDDAHNANHGARRLASGEWVLSIVDSRAAKQAGMSVVPVGGWPAMIEEVLTHQPWLRSRCRVTRVLEVVLRHLSAAERRDFPIWTFGDEFHALISALAAAQIVPVPRDEVANVLTGACWVADEIVGDFRAKLRKSPELRKEWQLPAEEGEGEGELDAWLEAVKQNLESFVPYALECCGFPAA